MTLQPWVPVRYQCIILGLVGGLVLMSVGPAPAQERPCGTSRGDRCPAPPGDPCGVHRNSADCRADGRCRAMRYRGPYIATFVSCRIDARGFAPNCAWRVVGCISAR